MWILFVNSLVEPVPFHLDQRTIFGSDCFCVRFDGYCSSRLWRSPRWSCWPVSSKQWSDIPGPVVVMLPQVRVWPDDWLRGTQSLRKVPRTEYRCEKYSGRLPVINYHFRVWRESMSEQSFQEIPGSLINLIYSSPFVWILLLAGSFGCSTIPEILWLSGFRSERHAAGLNFRASGKNEAASFIFWKMLCTTKAWIASDVKRIQSTCIQRLLDQVL